MDFQSALEVNPTSHRSLGHLATVEALQNMAHIYSEILERPADALIQLNKALQLQPHDTMSLAGRGVLLARLGDVPAAVRDAELLETLTIDPVTQYQVACIYSLCSRHDSAFLPRALDALAASLRRDDAVLSHLTADPDIEAIRGAEAFQKLVEAARTIHGIEEK
jgi:hypothetical protein